MFVFFVCFSKLCSGLLAGLDENIVTTKKGKVKDRSWGGAKKQMLGNIKGFVETLKKFKDISDAGNVPDINWKEVRPYLLLEHFNYETIKGEYSTCLKCKYDKYDKDKHVQTRTNTNKHEQTTIEHTPDTHTRRSLCFSAFSNLDSMSNSLGF